MNSAFRDVIFVNDLTLFSAWLLALLVAIIRANLMEDIGLTTTRCLSGAQGILGQYDNGLWGSCGRG